MERILLVEDDAQITASLSAFLQSEGFSVETATGETQARQLVEQTAPGLLLVDVQSEKGRVTRDGRDVYLSALEYRLLLVFLSHRGKVLSRSQLLEEIWDAAGDFVNDNTLTVYIKRLREKIETDPADPQIIRTVRGIGYMVDA